MYTPRFLAWAAGGIKLLRISPFRELNKNKIKSLEECWTSVQNWMFIKKVKLNTGKIEFMLIANKCHHNKFVSKFPVDILNNSIPPAAHIIM